MSESFSLNKFYERDIIEFLDEYAKENNINNSKDIITQLDESLSEKKFDQVNEIFKDLVENFNRLSENSAYKDLTYKQLLKAFKLIKSYLDESNKDLEIYKVIQDLEKTQDLSPEKRTYNINVYDRLEKRAQDEKKEQARKDSEIRADLDEKLKAIEKELYLSLRKKDVKRSIMLYKLQKQAFQRYPSRFMELKKEVYNSLLANYVQIQKIRGASEEEFNVPNKSKDNSQFSMEDINELSKEIEQLTEKNKFEDAKSKIVEINHKISKIPKEKESMKMMLESKVKSLNQRLELSRKIYEAKQHG